MKNWLLAAVFVVTWNENVLKEIKVWTEPSKPNSDGVSIRGETWNVFKVETTTKSITLATQKDVDLFLGQTFTAQSHFNELMSWPIRVNSLIGPNAFNVKVEEKR